jgi:hypothetical protein
VSPAATLDDAKPVDNRIPLVIPILVPTAVKLPFEIPGQFIVAFDETTPFPNSLLTRLDAV